MIRTSSRSRALFLALACIASSPSLGQTQILDVSSASLTTYSASASANQGALPQYDQRGVGIDGTLVSTPIFDWALNGNPFGDSWTTAPRVNDVLLSNGTYAPTKVDWAGPSPGASRWVIARSFYQHDSDNNGIQGYGWFQMSQPELSLYVDSAHHENDTIYLVYGADRYVAFLRTGASATTYKAKNGAAGYMQYVSGSPDTYVYTDQNGTQTTFFGGNTSGGRADWQIWKIVDTAGNTTYAGDSSSASSAATNGYNSDKTIATVYDASSGGGRRFTYAYTTVGANNRLQKVTVETLTSGSWTSSPVTKEVARVTYSYNTSAINKLPTGYLTSIEVRTSLSDSSAVLNKSTDTPSGNGIYLTKTTYLRYYDDDWSNSDGRRGSAGMLKLVLSAEGARNYDWQDNATFDGSYASASDSALKPYAEAYFEYPSGSDWKPSKAYFNGACGCSGSTGIYTFTYETNAHFSGTTGYDTAWHHRTVVGQPDGSYATWYFDEVGQALSKIVTDTDPAGSPSKTWVTQVIRNSSGQVTEIRSPASITNYYHADVTGFNAGDIVASGSVGMITTIDRVSSGDMVGFPEATRVQSAGTGGSNTYVTWKSYTSTDYQYAAGPPVVAVIRPLISAVRSYHDESSTTDSAKYNETDMSYAVWGPNNGSTTNLSLKTVTTTYPKVVDTNNGRGTSAAAVVSERFIREDGTTAFSLQSDYSDAADSSKIYSYTQFTNGQVTKQIMDVATNGTFASGDDPNTDFGITETSNGKNLVTTYEYDEQGRATKVVPPEWQATSKYRMLYYSLLADGRSAAISIPLVDTISSTVTYFGPGSYSIANLAGKGEFSGTLAIASTGTATGPTSWITETSSDPIGALHTDLKPLFKVSTSLYEDSGTRLTASRMYFSIPSSGAGSAGTNYDETLYFYDTMGRAYRTKTVTGDITRFEFDELGRTLRRSIGTNDHAAYVAGDTQAESSGTDNMVKIEELEYDGGSSGGNSHLTTRTQFIQDSTTDDRVTTYLYDPRGRLIVQEGPQAPYMVMKYDNLSRAIASGQYSSTSGLTASVDPTSTATNRVALSETTYDEMGRAFKTTRHKIDQSDGSDDDSLSNSSWYDGDSRVIKTRGEQLSKTFYDRLGRVTNQFTLAKVDEADDVYSDAQTVTSDTVLEETDTYFDDPTGNALMTVRIERHPNDTTTTGALNTGTSAYLVDYAGGKIKGRAQITSMFYDTLNRLTDTVAEGTFGGSNFDRTSGTDANTTRSNTNLVTSYLYNDSGTVLEVKDPREIKTHTLYDDAGRKTATIANFVDGTPSGDNGDDDVYTRYEYAKGLMTEMWVDFDGDGVKDTSDQRTKYIYGATKGTPTQMKIASGSALRAVVYPDSSNSGTTVANIDSDSSDVVSYAYNALGQQTYTKDQAGNIIETDYDTGGRQTERRATLIQSGYDNTIKRIETTYLSRGLTDKVTQYDNATVSSGTKKDELQYSYDDWGNVTNFNQDVDSGIGATGRAAFAVSYGYTKVAPTGGRATIRRDSMTFPDSTMVDYSYGSSGAISDTAVRVASLKQSSVTIASYDYLGAGQVVTTTLDEAGVNSSVFNSGATTYPNLDDFNRVKESKWTKTADFYDVALTYDRDSGVTVAQDNILVGATSPTRQFDAVYTNDGLNRLSDAKEGNWTGSSFSTTKREQQWTLNQPGDWIHDKIDADGNGTFETDWSSAFNKVNEYTSRSNGSSTSVGYNAVGEMTDVLGIEYIYDVWGRLVKVDIIDGATIAEYKYNGLGFCIGWHYDTTRSGGGAPDGNTDSNDPWFYFCYDPQWRIVATYRGSDSSAKERFVWHNAGANGLGGSSYIDSVVLRDKDANTNWYSSADGTLENRIFYCQNWRADVSVIVGTDGTPIERIKYNAYGVPSSFSVADYNLSGSITTQDNTDYGNALGLTDLNFDGSVDKADDTVFSDSYSAGSTGGIGVLSRSLTDNRIGYAGYQWDTATSCYIVRARFVHPHLGWLRRDPLQIEGQSLYSYCGDDPLNNVDPTGMVQEALCTRTQPRMQHGTSWAPGVGSWQTVKTGSYDVHLPGQQFTQRYIISGTLTAQVSNSRIEWNLYGKDKRSVLVPASPDDSGVASVTLGSVGPIGWTFSCDWTRDPITDAVSPYLVPNSFGGNRALVPTTVPTGEAFTHSEMALGLVAPQYVRLNPAQVEVSVQWAVGGDTVLVIKGGSISLRMGGIGSVGFAWVFPTNVGAFDSGMMTAGPWKYGCECCAWLDLHSFVYYDYCGTNTGASPMIPWP